MNNQKNNFIELYKIVTEEAHYFLNEHQKRISFYVSLLTALIGGIVIGFFYSKYWYHYLLLVLGPITLIRISSIAKLGTERMYQRFLEAITVRAKLEHRLGMDLNDQNNKSWLKNEPLITKRHMDSRNNSEYKSSKEWD